MQDSLTTMMWQRLEQDKQARLRNARNLAEQDNPVGLYEMGIRYRNGWGVQQNYKLAITYLDKAALQKHAGACYELARLYLEGNDLADIEQNLDKALKYTKIVSNNDSSLFSGISNYNQADYIRQVKGLELLIESQIQRSKGYQYSM